MSTDPKRPDVGDLVIDASHLASSIIDLPVGGRVGLRSSQRGCAAVLAEIRGNQPIHGVRAGVRDEDVVAIDQAMARIEEIDRLLPAARKLVELLDETRAVLDDSVQRRISMVADAVDSRAKLVGHGDLLPAYETTREYRSAAALKARRTRLRNEAARDLDAEAPVEDPDVPDDPPAELDA